MAKARKIDPVKEAEEVKQLFKQLARAPRHRFPTEGVQTLAGGEHGVYVITDKAGKVAHVGRTVRGKNGLSQRLRDHLRGTSSFACSYLKKNGNRPDGHRALRTGYEYQFLAVLDDRKRALLEALTVGKLCPLHLGLGAALPK